MKTAIVKNLAKTVAFIVILAVIVLALQTQFVPYQFQDTIQAGTFFNYTEEDSVDVLISGTSSIMVSISPLRIYEDAQIVSHVRGNSRQPPQALYLDVKEALKSQHPKLIACSAAMLLTDFDVDKEEVRVRRSMDDMPLTWDKIEVAGEVVDESEWQTLSSYVLPILRYHDRWVEIRDGLQVGNRKDYDYKHGQWAVYKTVPQEDVSAEKMKDDTPVQVTESSMKWYRKVADLCRENDIQLLLVTTPDLRQTEGRHEAFARAAEELGADYLDYNVDGITAKCGLDWKKDFYDNHHANAGGSLKVTDYFVEYIQDRYNLKASDVSPEVQKHFEEDIAHFKDVLKEKGF
ncbi:MAG: hypothetical protein MJ161_01380 [Clostridia bacterium]|nr:hypothetical protein [Clostridia bacterium]